MNISSISPEMKSIIATFSQQMADIEQKAIEDQKKADAAAESQGNS
ncbi:MAG: hypothetical protein V4487_04490 [Chlamydiota bacterium]